MGARPEDYEMSSPQRSFIHVDEFDSPKELAEYLHILDRNDELYNSYFKWKGTGEFINTYFWCRLCSLLHDEEAINQSKCFCDSQSGWRK
jgi:glycoprotein 3-alpha-L-fucosyltransferase